MLEKLFVCAMEIVGLRIYLYCCRGLRSKVGCCVKNGLARATPATTGPRAGPPSIGISSPSRAVSCAASKKNFQHTIVAMRPGYHMGASGPAARPVDLTFCHCPAQGPAGQRLALIMGDCQFECGRRRVGPWVRTQDDSGCYVPDMSGISIHGLRRTIHTKVYRT